MSDTKGQIKNFYTLLPKEFRNNMEKDPSYPKTLIEKNSMCLVVGGTEAGKTNF
jgi:polynucleotide 5'-kinase involved in rRNA processing